VTLSRTQTGEIPLPVFLPGREQPATVAAPATPDTRSTAVGADRASAIDAINAVAAHPYESALLVLGEPGSGKSHALMAAYTSSTLRPVLVRANPAEADVPLSGFSAVFGAIADVRITRAAVDLTVGAHDPAGLFGLANEFLARLRGFDLSPTVVFVDDVDRMDEGSRELLGFVAGRVAGTGIRLIATATTADGVLAGMTSLTLGPLTPLESMDVLTAAAGPTADEGTLQLLAHSGGGSALALVTGLRKLTGEQLAGQSALELPLRPGSAVKAIASQRLAARTEAEVELLRLASLAPVVEWKDLRERAADDVDALEELLDSGLLVRHDRFVSCADPLLRAYLYWGMRHADRRRHHEQALERAKAGSIVAAWHADGLGRADASALAAAANELLVAGLDAEALEFAEHSIAAVEAKGADAGGLVELARRLLRSGEPALGQRLLYFARVDELSPADAIELLMTSAAAHFVRTGLVPEDDLSTAIDLHQHLDPVAAAKVLTFTAALHAARWRPEEAEIALAHASALVKQTGGRPSTLWSMTHALTERLFGRQTIAVGPVDATRLVHRGAGELLVLAQLLTLEERYAEARRVISLVQGRNRSMAPLWSDFLSLLTVENDIRSGDLHRVLDVDAEWPVAATARYGARRTLLRSLAASLTDGAVVSELIDATQNQASAEHNVEILARSFGLRATLAVLEARFGEALEPLEWLESVSDRLVDPSLLRHRGDLIESYAALDRLPEARALLERFEAAAEQHPSRWSTLALGRARAVLTDDAVAVAAFRAAVREHGPTDPPLEYARTLLSYARRLDALGVKVEAERTYAAARAAFEAAGASGWATLVTPAAVPGAAVRRVQAVAPTLASLTDEEREIIERVRLGHRNGEIAAALFISLRTVELRLTRVYRKLGVKSRAHLVAVLSGSQSA
jgi:DNA-binding CsgD family transcriptional regulator